MRVYTNTIEPQTKVRGVGIKKIKGRTRRCDEEKSDNVCVFAFLPRTERERGRGGMSVHLSGGFAINEALR